MTRQIGLLTRMAMKKSSRLVPNKMPHLSRFRIGLVGSSQKLRLVFCCGSRVSRRGGIWSLPRMSTTTIFHLRALVCASVHFVLCALLGVTVLALAMVDMMTTSSELPPPWWITAGQWLLTILSAPAAVFFGFWDDVHWAHSVSLALALAWSVFLGYSISFVCHIARKSMIKRASETPHPL